MFTDVRLGTLNPIKRSALQAVLLDTPALARAKLDALSVSSGVSDQPKTLDETFAGAEQRARAAYEAKPRGEGVLAVGIEDGLFANPRVAARHLNICVTCIFDGEALHFGTSSAFEYPPEVTRLVFEQQLNISEAMNASGYTKNPDLGRDVGAIGVLSKGRMVRREYTQQAIRAALIKLY